MARRTKEAAAETRNRLLDTAEQVFIDKGVSRTSLDDIAAAAGVTRGAIYWHFKNKSDLFEAMMQRMKLPLEELMVRATEENADDPFASLRARSLTILKRLAIDTQWQRVSEICRFKVEYVDEMETYLRKRHLECRNSSLLRIEDTMREGMKRGQLSAAIDPKLSAVGLYALVDGLINNWLLDRKYLSLSKSAAPAIDAYLRGLLPRAGDKPAARRKTKKKRA